MIIAWISHQIDQNESSKPRLTTLEVKKLRKQIKELYTKEWGSVATEINKRKIFIKEGDYFPGGRSGCYLP